MRRPTLRGINVFSSLAPIPKYSAPPPRRASRRM
jgi:hypothetical protein